MKDVQYKSRVWILAFLVILCTCILPDVLSPEADQRPRAPLCILIIITERRSTSSIIEQYESWTEPQFNLRITWVCCAERSPTCNGQGHLNLFSTIILVLGNLIQVQNKNENLNCYDGETRKWLERPAVGIRLIYSSKIIGAFYHRKAGGFLRIQLTDFIYHAKCHRLKSMGGKKELFVDK